MLFEDVMAKEHCKLTKLDISQNLLRDKCMPRFCKALQDERCKLTKLSLYSNDFSDHGKKDLSDVKKCNACEARCLRISI